ncbi:MULTISPECIES: hypothetical protein [Methanocorpusculum]|jgi:hypothetical protein|uniref:Class I SAM-dependent methyltransferase n=1 Tax=Methanocorpusculum parvum TaxID=2193 RepID=A0AAX0Q948_9EURY|nr:MULTISPECIES: hypothetical protein [Methanocorpusculum]MDD3047368.1 hypothetical protein [Methanocorpusculum sp.]MDD4423922.1 hypothetical protein [Methanocorpusculum parvum]MEA5086625.1 hypothetical protein [Methanocorpusculum sp.]PAV09419.1 hypothetical protein ASJ83_02230 [Methanocorpusculum parvum]
MSKLSAMLELDELRMLEPDYASLVNNGEPGVLICEAEPADKGARLLIDEDESPLLFAVKSGDEWCGTSWLFRSPTAGEFSLFEAADGDIYQEDRGNVEDACRAYYAEIIQTVIAPAGDDLTEERVGKVRGLLHEVWGPSISGTALDACAGSGIGSLLLREMGADPIAYDNDPELLALGLSSGRLAPGRTACIDARAASAYLPDAEYGVGIMFGQIYGYTKDIWRPIVEELAGITEKTLITVATQEEAFWVQEWADGVDRTLSIMENTRDPIYDRWVCFG